MKIAYFDCFSGISGDMTLGAFVDLGVPLDWLIGQLRKLPIQGFDIKVEHVKRHGIGARSVDVIVDDCQPARRYRDIAALIEKSPLGENVRRTSLSVFEKLARAEATIHDVSKEAVHFHEVGGMDAIVDVVGTALCKVYLGIQRIAASRIPLGKGWVRCAHGRLPLPAPATVAILKDVPVYGVDIESELVTPTGAAIIKTLAQRFEEMPPMRPSAVGYGAGKKDIASQPNLLRVVLGEAHDSAGADDARPRHDAIVVVETNIDDMNPEIYGYLMERLLADGALDVLWIPVYMKKNRPGVVVQVLCAPDHKQRIINRLLNETTSIGLRCHPAERTVLPRKQHHINTGWGTVALKSVTTPDGRRRSIPEFESCRQIAVDNNITLLDAYNYINNVIVENRTDETDSNHSKETES